MASVGHGGIVRLFASDDIAPDDRRPFGDLVVQPRALRPIVDATTATRPGITQLIHAYFAASFVATR
ncbi:hypothetical protein [Burkholderia sola]|uniref:hypothetical protein n=1 Tax=Burkholderia sola TaxID=2843302 RepID=UPI0023DD88B3|nr:hypothetical protein [Burkholderia sola]MDF3084124.1 hypothetical protein [Burkholderia sola]